MSSDQQPELRPATPAAAGRTGFPTFWTHPATVVGAVGVILLIVTTLALLALRRDSSSAAPRGGDATNSTASPSGGSVSAPTVPMLPMSAPPGGARPGGGASGKAGAGADGGQDDGPQGTNPPRDATTTPPRPQQAPRSGSLTLAHKGSTDLDDSDGKADVVVHRNDIGTKEDGQFAVWSGSASPSPAQCASAGGWVTSVPADQVSKGRFLCVSTTAGRSAVVKFTAVEKNPGGKLDRVTFDFKVWS